MGKYVMWWVLMFFAGNAVAQMSGYGDDWWEEEGVYYRIAVSEEGVYRLTEAGLRSAGVPVEDISAGEWVLWREGERQPLYVNEEDGAFFLEFRADQQRSDIDSLLFQGGAEDVLNPAYSMFTDTASYFLSWSSEDTAPRWSNVEGVTAPSPVERRRYYERKEHRIFKEQWAKPYFKVSGANLYSSEFQRGEGFSSELTQSFTETIAPEFLYDADMGGRLSLRYLGDFDTHDFQWRINDEEVWRENRSSFGLEQIEVELEPGVLEDAFTHTFEGKSGSRDRFYLALRTLSYAAVFEETEAKVQGRVDTGEVVLSLENAPEEEVIYYDREQGVRYEFSPELAGEWWLSNSPGAHHFSYIKSSAIDTLPPPELVVMPQREEWMTADYIILCGQRLDGGSESEAIQDYADYRRTEAGGGYSVAIIEVESLYDAFGYGVQRHPLAIRNFSAWLRDHNPNAPSVFIIGKGREYRYIRAAGQLSSAEHRGFSVPTYGYPSSDNLLLAERGKSAPAFPMGRLSAESAGDIRSYLEKVQAQEQERDLPTVENSFWRKKVMHLVGGGEVQPLVESYMDIMSDRLRGSTWDPELQSFRRGSSSSTERPVTDEIYDQINEGVSLVTFFGHSATNSLGFDINIGSKYDNRPRHPFLLALGCYGGNINTSELSVGEIYSSFEGGGFIGSIASSGPGEVTRLYLFARKFYSEMGESAHEETLGELFRRALVHRQDSDPRHVQQFMYYGDPALRLYKSGGPDYTFDGERVEVSPQPLNVGTDSLTITVDLVNLGQKIADSITIDFRREGPEGIQIQEQRLRIPAPGNRQSISTRWEVGNESWGGLNTFFAQIDPEEMIDEFPSPAASNNNQLETTGESGFPFFVFANGVELAWPYNYSIIPSDSIRLVAHTSNPMADSSSYIFELDTVASFSSPFLRSYTTTASGGELEWKISAALEEEKVYYWRAALPTPGVKDTVWEQASFVHLEGQEGWNQSHIGQWLESDSLFLNHSRYRLELPEEALNITIQNRVKGASQSPNFVANGVNVGSVNRAWDLVDEGIGICVIDTIIFTLQANSGDGLYGSVNDNRTTRAFVYRTDNPESRADAIYFLDSIIPQHSHVFIFTIFDSERMGSSLQIDEWAADSSVMGTSLIEALERRGATSLQNLMNEERQVYNFFYKNTPSGYVRLQEDFLFSTEDVLVNSETIGRRLPEGYFLSPEIPLREDSLWFSLSYVQERAGDSVVVDALDGEGQNQFTHSSSDSLLWIRPEGTESLQLLTRLMNFESRIAPEFQHIRLFQSELTDLFWTPNQVKAPNDTFYYGNVFEWTSALRHVSHRPDTDSVPVAINIRKGGQIAYRDTLMAVWADSLFHIEVSLQTLDWPSGELTLTAQINPLQEIEEQRYTNNTLSYTFKLLRETVTPILRVQMDDRVINNRAVVGRYPKLTMEVQKVNGQLPIEIQQLEYSITQPDGSLYEFTDSVAFQYSEGNDLLLGQWTEDLDLDATGMYSLEVIYRPIGGSTVDETHYRIEFQRIDDPSISHTTVAPNPTTGPVFLHYSLVGPSGPSRWSMVFMSSDGRIVHEMDSSHPLLVGDHRISLGKLPSGLPDGLYFYELQLFDDRGQLFTGEDGQLNGSLLYLRP